MLVHVVLFNLAAGMSDEEKSAFEKDLRSLGQIEHAESVHIGTLAETAKRPVVQTDWDFMLTVVCKDVAAHDAYQDHPIHHAFIANQKKFFDKVRVFDAD